jgi:hypothetical protein
VFNAGGTAIQPPECSGGNSNKFLVFNSATYVTFNWIELTGLYWNSDQYNSCWSTTAFVSANGSDYITLSNFYIHNWSVGPSATDADHLIAVGSGSPWCEQQELRRRRAMEHIEYRDSQRNQCFQTHHPWGVCE